MAEEHKYHKVKSKGRPIVFMANERWVQMKDLADGSYYISDYGRVSRLNPQGIFHELKQSMHCKSTYVSIEFDNKVHTRKRVGRLVLKYFVGGEKEKRRYVHLNGDKYDNRLVNLRWCKGFVDDVDYNFLNRINTSRMASESQIVRTFLLTEEPAPLFELIDSYKPLIRYIDYHNNTNYLKANDYIGFILIVMDRIKEGKFKPNVRHKELVTFKNFVVSVFRDISYKYNSIREFYISERHERIITDEHQAMTWQTAV